ncbi:putative trehalose operon repressor [Actinomyces johnsonii F0542]|uniref:Putative trehalose operon repressor n=1 Tax=Actinomyces johnsonii F0542 TaxID=1321818 RepID=U1QG14_9ACTO|nr:putative trehalose operon repressor [Actinomyces johnsonii F0542]
MHPRVKDDHAALIGPRVDPMGPCASRERPWDAPEQADEVLTAHSHFHPLTHLAASLVETAERPATSSNGRSIADDGETSDGVILVCTSPGRRPTPTARDPEEERSLPVAQAKYDQIFQTLHERIESGTYRFLELLPSENALAEEFGCTRNTVRKALALLVTQGYVQTMQGRGIQVISRSRATSTFLVGGIESLREAAERNRISLSTHMISLEEGVVDAETAEASGMAEGAEIICVKRLRVLDNVPLIVDTSYFLASVVPRLTRQIVESSVYAHLEEVLGVRVASATRRITVERATEEDQRLIHLGGMDCVVVVSSTTFDSTGVLFEYTRSRHSPVDFAFQDTAHRLPAER